MHGTSSTSPTSRRWVLLEGYASRWWWLALLAALVLLPGTARAQEENRAGLVIVFGDGRVAQQCVAFAEDSISGYDLLQRSGLPLGVEAGAIGPTVCSIDSEGCSFPAQSCFCRCQGSPCLYWSYWRLQADGAWQYQSLGAGNTQVRNGNVEGWHWAAGTRQDAEEPPPVSFAEVCGEPLQQAASTTVDSAVTAAGMPGATPVSLLAPAGAVEPGEGAAEAGSGLSGWVLAGAVVIPAAALVMWALARKRR